MRAKGRKQGRFIGLSGLKKIPSPAGSRFPLIIVDSSGLPVFPLCEWYRRKKEFDLGRTPTTYLDMILPYFGFLIKKKYTWNAEPSQVRTYLVEFLRNDVGCQVGAAPNDGYLIETTGASPLSKSSLGVLLAALTNLYDILTDAGYYVYHNPMRSEQLAVLKREHLRQVKNAGAPDHAGIRSETHPETKQAYSTTFFRQKRGKVWEPDIVMEPDATQESLCQTIDFMIQHATFLRDQVILLLLRQTGARLSEVVEMSVGGYRKARHAGRALVKNKGSQGREEKTIYFTDVIEQLLLKYVRTERAIYDPQGHKRLEDLDDQASLFLTRYGTPYTRASFYHHWYKLFKQAHMQNRNKNEVEFSVHDIRHLRVSRAITSIKQSAKGDPLREAELTDGFRLLMGWRSPKTMDIYTHVFNKRQALLEVMLEESENEPERQPARRSPLHIADHDQQEVREQKNKAMASTLDNDNDNFAWYEE